MSRPEDEVADAKEGTVASPTVHVQHTIVATMPKREKPELSRSCTPEQAVL